MPHTPWARASSAGGRPSRCGRNETGRRSTGTIKKEAAMILGMSISTYTTVHVVISLVGILSGFVVLFGLLTGKRMDGWTALFLVTTVATSVTGFAFPFHGFGPPHYVGMISLVVLALAIVA